MGVLRAIGRFFGKALRTIGHIGGQVISPMSQLATAVAPMGPALSAAGPVGAAVGTAATLAPGILAVAKQASNLATSAGNALAPKG